MKDVSQEQKTSNNSNDFRRLNSLLHRTLSNTIANINFIHKTTIQIQIFFNKFA